MTILVLELSLFSDSNTGATLGTQIQNNGSGRLLDVNSSTGTKFTILNSGNVGIGVPNPAVTLELDGNGGAIRLPSGGELQFGGSDNMLYGNSANNYLKLITNGSEAMRINSDGELGVGTSDPQSRIDAGGGYLANEQGRADHVANTMPSPYYRFDGSGDQINLGDSAILDMDDGEISFSAIVKLNKQELKK